MSGAPGARNCYSNQNYDHNTSHCLHLLVIYSLIVVMLFPFGYMRMVMMIGYQNWLCPQHVVMRYNRVVIVVIATIT